jgi:two-component system OmpR family sensor kinase
MQYNAKKDLILSDMKQNSSEISALIINAHMSHNPLDLRSLKIKEGFKYALFDKDQKVIYSNIKHPISFSKQIYTFKGCTGIISANTFGHKGVYFVVIEEDMFISMIDDFTKKVLLTLIGLFILFSLIGYWLAKLFIKPIQIEREKLNRFINDSTHELNTPITALLMSIASKDLTSKKNINRIKLSANRISQIYEDLTYISLKDKELNHPKEFLSFSNLLNEQISYIKPMAEKKKITIHTDIEEFSLLFDKESAIRLTNNLILNAIKYTNLNGNIYISLKDKTLIIKDDGIGISEDKLTDVFNRFCRATTTSGGFGIGLDIVNEVVKRYKIKLDLSSKLGSGTTFTLKF